MTERSGISWAGPLGTKAVEDMTRDELIEALICSIRDTAALGIGAGYREQYGVYQKRGV